MMGLELGGPKWLMICALFGAAIALAMPPDSGDD